MEKVEVNVLCPDGTFEIYVNGALVKTITTTQALRRYLRWLWYANCEKIVNFDLHIFGSEYQKELREYIFG